MSSEPRRGRDLRVHERFEWNDRCEVCWFPDGQPSSPESLKCVDLGLGGIGLISPSPLAVGTRGAVLLHCDGQSGCVRDVEVTHCRFDPVLQAHIVGGKWLAGTSCADHLMVTRTKKGPQLEVRTCGLDEPRERGAA